MKTVLIMKKTITEVETQIETLPHTLSQHYVLSRGSRGYHQISIKS